MEPCSCSCTLCGRPCGYIGEIKYMRDRDDVRYKLIKSVVNRYQYRRRRGYEQGSFVSKDVVYYGACPNAVCDGCGMRCGAIYHPRNDEEYKTMHKYLKRYEYIRKQQQQHNR